MRNGFTILSMHMLRLQSVRQWLFHTEYEGCVDFSSGAAVLPYGECMVRQMIYVFHFEKKSSYLFNMFFSLFHRVSGENMWIFPSEARGLKGLGRGSVGFRR